MIEMNKFDPWNCPVGCDGCNYDGKDYRECTGYAQAVKDGEITEEGAEKGVVVKK